MGLNSTQMRFLALTAQNKIKKQDLKNQQTLLLSNLSSVYSKINQTQSPFEQNTRQDNIQNDKQGIASIEINGILYNAVKPLEESGIIPQTAVFNCSDGSKTLEQIQKSLGDVILTVSYDKDTNAFTALHSGTLEAGATYSVINNNDIFSKIYDKELAKQLQEYQNEALNIEKENKSLEIRLKGIDAESSVLTEEIESLKAIIDKDVTHSLKVLA